MELAGGYQGCVSSPHNAQAQAGALLLQLHFTLQLAPGLGLVLRVGLGRVPCAGQAGDLRAGPGWSLPGWALLHSWTCGRGATWGMAIFVRM